MEPFILKFEIPSILIGDGVSVEVQGTARLKLKDDFLSIRRAAQTMLNKTHREKVSVITSMIDEASRKVLKSVDPQRLVNDRDGCGEEIRKQAMENMDKIGYELQSISFSEISDKLGYINSLARRITAEKKARLAIEEAYIAREGKAIASMIKRDAQIQRIGESMEEKARIDIAMDKVIENTEEYFKAMKERLDKGVKGISQNLYSPDEKESDSSS